MAEHLTRAEASELMETRRRERWREAHSEGAIEARKRLAAYRRHKAARLEAERRRRLDALLSGVDGDLP